LNISISKKELKKYIEPHFYDALAKEEYTILTIEATKLFTYNRFDIAFKLLYLEMFEYDLDFAKEIYAEHIRAFSLGKFKEPGNEEKNSIDKYFKAFHHLLKEIKKSGFNRDQTLIPLSSNGTIVNGAHRVACAIFLNKDVSCVELEVRDYLYDYRFFYRRNISNEILDAAVTKFVEYANNIYIAFIWPSSKSHWQTVEEIIPNIVYRKEVKLNYNGAHNLLSQIYYEEEWLGSVENNFLGAKGKLVECFTSFDPVKVIVFQADNLKSVQKIKEHFREVFDIGKHSIHITDTKEEAQHVSQVIFNDNSIHFLNYAKPNRCFSTHEKINIFKAFMQQNNIDAKNILLDASLVLSAYGLREAKDIDYLCRGNKKILKKYTDINDHDEVLVHYDHSKNELIYNPKYHFYFNGLKFVSFPQLYKMKRNRAEEKDEHDCIIVEALLENNSWKQYVGQINQFVYYKKIKLRKRLIYFLQILGLYKISKSIYRVIKGQK